MADYTKSSAIDCQQAGEQLATIDIHKTMAALLAERQLLDSLIAGLEGTLGNTPPIIAGQSASQSKRRCRNRNSHEIMTVHLRIGD